MHSTDQQRVKISHSDMECIHSPLWPLGNCAWFFTEIRSFQANLNIIVDKRKERRKGE